MEPISLAKIGLAAVKWVWKGARLVSDVVSWWYLGSLYEQSHTAYVRRHQLGKIYHELGHFLEVSIQTTNMFRKTRGYEARIALRTQSHVTGIVDMAKIFIRTEGWAGRQQETLIACKIGRQWENLKLNNMPDVDLEIVDEHILPQVGEIHIDAVEVSYQKTLYTSDGSQEVILYPTYQDHLNEVWVIRWGRSYHLWQYLQGKDELRLAIIGALLQHFEYYSNKSLRLDAYIRKPIVYLITCNFVLSSIYPLLAATGCISVDDKGQISSQLKWINIKNIRALLRFDDEVLDA